MLEQEQYKVVTRRASKYFNKWTPVKQVTYQKGHTFMLVVLLNCKLNFCIYRRSAFNSIAKLEKRIIGNNNNIFRDS